MDRRAGWLLAVAALGAAVGPAPSSAEPAPRVALLEAPPHRVSFALDSPEHPRLGMLTNFRDASIERLGPLRLYTTGHYGAWVTQPWETLEWLGGSAADARVASVSAPLDGSTDRLSLDTDVEWRRFFDKLSRRTGAFEAPLLASTGATLFTDGFSGVFDLPPSKPVVDWRCRRRPVMFLRFGAESDKFDLVRCDGSTALEALDRLSILARPPDVERPSGELLPDEADDAAWSERREWTAGVRVVHPRLVWVMQKIADAFPWKAIYVYSGYRPNAEVHDGSPPGMGHQSLHATGRALDISVFNVRKEDLFKACQELKDVGCGFYPNLPFVHVDVRPAGKGKAFWIDTSSAGEPAHYVDSWPGVVESGGLSWVPKN
ncbi:MAG: D-Ala-D-Ala carboxypeptidase family metallohydrolase [Polyangiaceae bacterium]